MTSAPSVASGRSSNRPVRNSNVTTVTTAATSPESSERAPADALTAVLERLPDTAMPWQNPDPMLAAPTPMSSRLGSIS